MKKKSKKENKRTLELDLFLRDSDLNHPFLSASWPWWLSRVRVVLISRNWCSGRVRVPVDRDSLEGRGGLGLPLGVDKRLRCLYSSWKSQN